MRWVKKNMCETFSTEFFDWQIQVFDWQIQFFDGQIQSKNFVQTQSKNLH